MRDGEYIPAFGDLVAVLTYFSNKLFNRNNWQANCTRNKSGGSKEAFSGRCSLDGSMLGAAAHLTAACWAPHRLAGRVAQTRARLRALIDESLT